MKYQIEITRLWWATRNRFYTPGEYRVPDDMPEDHAKKAIDEKAGSRVSKKTAAPENKAKTAAPESKSASSGK